VRSELNQNSSAVISDWGQALNFLAIHFEDILTMITTTTPALLPEPSGDYIIHNQASEVIIEEQILLSLIIPTFNEGGNVACFVQRVTDLLNRYIPGNYELIIVDDNSPDGTWKIAQDLTIDYPQLKVMRRTQERGLSSAVVRGWQCARGAVLGVMDGDLQHPPEALIQLLKQVQHGADLAVASRHVKGGGVSDWSLMRRILSRGAQLIGLLILPNVVGRTSDPMSGYFVVRRRALAEEYLSPTGYKILLEVLGRGNVKRVAEVGYVFQERQDGESKVTWKQYVEYIVHLLRLRANHQSTPPTLHPRNRRAVNRFLRFILVGLSGVFVDMTVFYLLSDPSTLGWGITRSKMMAAEVAIFNNFIWNDRWTFGDVSSYQQGWKKRLKRFLKFNLICSLGLILNILVLNLLFNYLGINRYIANIIAIALVTLWNFWANLKLGWRVTDTRQ
jgi:dolichol-phosphate mannosyltransferase